MRGSRRGEKTDFLDFAERKDILARTQLAIIYTIRSLMCAKLRIKFETKKQRNKRVNLRNKWGKCLCPVKKASILK